MSVTTNDLNIYSATTSTTYKHKRYYGPLSIPIGFTYSDPTSVAAVQAFLTDSVIKGLSYSELSTDPYFAKYMDFSDQYFIYAFPTLIGNIPLSGMFVNFMFNTDFTKIKGTYSFANEYGHIENYDVWISDFKLTENPVLFGVYDPFRFS